MNRDKATEVFENLGSGVRLDVFRFLVKRAPAGAVVGEILAELDVQASNLSFHLKALSYTGLISCSQEGRNLRYCANLALMQDLIDYLTKECCSGQPELCGIEADAKVCGS